MCTMRLFAAIVPPRDVLQEVVDVVDSVHSTPTPGLQSARRWRRRGGKGAKVADREATTPPTNVELARPPIDRMHIPIASFGNVTLGDSTRLVDVLRETAATWSRPEVRFAGAAALEFPGDESIWATLAGDVDGLMVIGRGVPDVGKRLGFFVDRRVFRPWLSVGTITDETTAPYLERLVAAIEGWEGRLWTVDAVWLMRRPAEAVASDAYEEMERLPLASV
jgi:RNA 2',3'-cyclic 3'-phosphodiesterase